VEDAIIKAASSMKMSCTGVAGDEMVLWIADRVVGGVHEQGPTHYTCTSTPSTCTHVECVGVGVGVAVVPEEAQGRELPLLQIVACDGLLGKGWGESWWRWPP
jgi:hypothetical protein